MNKALKIILAVFVVGLLLVISPISNNKETNTESTNYIEAVVDSINANLPFDLGTIGRMDSMRYEKDQKMVWYYTVYDGGDMQEIYAQYHEDYKEVFKMAFVAMNGQNKMGNDLAKFLNTKHIDLELRVYSLSGEWTYWMLTGQELLDFMEAYAMSPTEALCKVIDFQIMIANLELPQKPGMKPASASVITNSIVEYDESCLIQSITHVGDDIFVEYLVDEKDYDLDFFEENQKDIEFSDFVAYTLSQDPDTRGFISMIAMAHSNWIIIFVGQTSKKEVIITIPYSILKKYSTIQNLI